MKTNFNNQRTVSRGEEYTRSHQTRYIAEIRHKGLGTYRIIKDLDSYILNNKIDAQFLIWDEKWSKIVTKTEKEAEREDSLTFATEKTADAKKAQKEIEDLLTHTLEIDDTIDWETLKKRNKFEEPNPKNELDAKVEKLRSSFSNLERVPREPNKSYYEPDFSLFDRIFKSLKEKKILDAEESYKKRVDEWNKDMAKYQKDLTEFEMKKEELIKDYDQLELNWKQKGTDFYKVQDENNNKIDELKKLYQSHDLNAVIEYCELVLNNSSSPDSFPKDFDLDYNPDTKLLIVEYQLPSPDCIPTLVEVKYIATKKEMKEVYLSEPQLFKIYDNAI